MLAQVLAVGMFLAIPDVNAQLPMQSAVHEFVEVYILNNHSLVFSRVK